MLEEGEIKFLFVERCYIVLEVRRDVKENFLFFRMYYFFLEGLFEKVL